jgi:hypothetical protein
MGITSRGRCRLAAPLVALGLAGCDSEGAGSVDAKVVFPDPGVAALAEAAADGDTSRIRELDPEGRPKASEFQQLATFTRVRVTRCWSLLGSCWILPHFTRSDVGVCRALGSPKRAPCQQG